MLGEGEVACQQARHLVFGVTQKLVNLGDGISKHDGMVPRLDCSCYTTFSLNYHGKGDKRRWF